MDAFSKSSLRALFTQAKQGNPEAQNQLGYLYFNGKDGLEKNYARAAEFYLLSAAAGFVHAQFNCGVIHEKGLGVKQSYEYAAQWYQKAADKNHSLASYNLSLLYRDGLGIKKDAKKSFKYCLIAAESGVSLAQNNLGWMYLEGVGVAKDHKQAFYWFSQAARERTEAIYHLAFCFEKGYGIDADEEKANQLYQIAADSGFQLAQERLEQIK